MTVNYLRQQLPAAASQLLHINEILLTTFLAHTIKFIIDHQSCAICWSTAATTLAAAAASVFYDRKDLISATEKFSLSLSLSGKSRSPAWRTKHQSSPLLLLIVAQQLFNLAAQIYLHQLLLPVHCLLVNGFRHKKPIKFFSLLQILRGKNSFPRSASNRRRRRRRRHKELARALR